MAMTIIQLMEKMPGAFLPDQAGDLDVIIQFKFTGEEAGDWVVAIKDGSCTAGEGNAENPTMTLTANSQDYIALVTGQLDAMKAFMQGKVQVAGDLNLAMKMRNFFKLN